MLKKTLLGFGFSMALLMLAAAHNAEAQSSSSSSGSNSASGSNSSSGSGAAAIINTTNNVPASTFATNTDNVNQRVTGGTNSTLNQSGHTTSDVTIRTTPTVYAPPVSGGNPCTLAVSGGVSVIGWGAAAGGTFVDEDCANRQKIAMVHNAGYQAAARELMCNDKASYNAFKTAGQPCAWRAAFEGGQPPMASQQPMPPPVVTPAPVVAPMAAKTYPRCTATVRDNCRS